MSVTHLPIYRSAFRFHVYVNDLVDAFPKKYHYTLGARMRKNNIQLWVNIELALVEKEKEKKLKYFKKAQKRAFRSRIYFKLAQTYSLVSLKQISYVFFELNDVEKQMRAIVKQC